MLKWAVALLLIGNIGYFLHGVLGTAPEAEREPQRLEAQIRPEVLRLLNGQEAVDAAAPSVPQPEPAGSAAAAAAVAPEAGPAVVTGETACWQAGGFTAAQASGLRGALGMLGWPAGAWEVSEVRSSGRWVVYMGRFNDEQMARKKTELRELRIDFREVSIPSLGPGLALGTFSTEAAAEQGMQDLTRKGVRTARVAQERPENLSYSLRLPAVTAEQRAVVGSLGGPLADRPLQRCE